MQDTKKLLNVKNMTKIAILSAVAMVLMMFDAPIPFLPPFYKIDLSEVVVMIGGFAMGPMAAVVIEFIKVFLNVAFTGSNTAYVGEITAFLMGISFTVPAAYIYHKHKNQKAAIKGMVLSAIIATIVAALLNYFVVLWAYGYFMGLSMETIISISHALLPIIDSKLTLVLLGCIPFNLIKWCVVTVFTALLYKHISPILHK